MTFGLINREQYILKPTPFLFEKVVILHNLSGNDVIHTLTKGRISTLYAKIQTADDAEVLYQIYRQFSVSDEDSNYKLYLADPGNGNLGKFYIAKCIILPTN